MSVFIHIGLPKTASTFLQTKYFSILDEKKMIVYNPPEVISNINLMLNHFNENILDHSLTDLGIKLSDSLALYKEQKVLISSEGLTTEGYSLSYGKQLSFLSKYIKNAKIILVLRDPCDWSISMYRQSVHQKNPQSITKSLTKNDYDNNLRQYTRIELIKSYSGIVLAGWYRNLWDTQQEMKLKARIDSFIYHATVLHILLNNYYLLYVIQVHILAM